MEMHSVKIRGGTCRVGLRFRRFSSVVVIDFPAPIESTYTSNLTTTSATYSRTACAAQQYHFEALQFTVTANGSFAFYSESVMDTIGMVYERAFDPSNPFVNWITSDDDNCPKSQFSIRVPLKVNTTYILVVTTYLPMERGNFTIIVFGPAHVELQRISK